MKRTVRFWLVVGGAVVAAWRRPSSSVSETALSLGYQGFALVVTADAAAGVGALAMAASTSITVANALL